MLLGCTLDPLGLCREPGCNGTVIETQPLKEAECEWRRRGYIERGD
jgi:hypothetical protein